MKQCKSFARYKGLRKPTCNGGKPCDACKRKYKAMHRPPLDGTTLGDMFVGWPVT